MLKTICGVDPGFSGFCALIGSDGSYIASAPIPLRSNTLVLTKETRVEIDTLELAALFKRWSPTIAIVEKVDASPAMGVVSAFRFGQGYGQIQGILAALNIQVRNAYPSVWKSSFGLTRDKSLSRAKAIELFPKHKEKFKQVKDADLAEALLLAHYGLRFVTVKTS